MPSSQRDDCKREQSAVGESLDLSTLRTTNLVLKYQTYLLVVSVVICSLAVDLLSLLSCSDCCLCLMLTYLCMYLGKNLACVLLVHYLLHSSNIL